MSPVVMATLVLSLYVVFYRFYAKGLLIEGVRATLQIRRERGVQTA